MKVYVASAFTDHLRAAAVADRLRAAGIEITRDWMEIARLGGEAVEQGEEARRELAEADLAGVRAADVLLVLTPDTKDLGCGCWVETGHALAFDDLRVVVSGKQRDRTIFTSVCTRFVTDDEAVAYVISLAPEYDDRPHAALLSKRAELVLRVAKQIEWRGSKDDVVREVFHALQAELPEFVAELFPQLRQTAAVFAVASSSDSSLDAPIATTAMLRKRLSRIEFLQFLELMVCGGDPSAAAVLGGALMNEFFVLLGDSPYEAVLEELETYAPTFARECFATLGDMLQPAKAPQDN